MLSSLNHALLPKESCRTSAAEPALNDAEVIRKTFVYVFVSNAKVFLKEEK